MRRAIYIGNESIVLTYGQTGYMTEEDVFIPDGSDDYVVLLPISTNFFFPNE